MYWEQCWHIWFHSNTAILEKYFLCLANPLWRPSFFSKIHRQKNATLVQYGKWLNSGDNGDSLLKTIRWQLDDFVCCRYHVHMYTEWVSSNLNHNTCYARPQRQNFFQVYLLVYILMKLKSGFLLEFISAICHFELLLPWANNNYICILPLT